MYTFIYTILYLFKIDISLQFVSRQEIELPFDFSRSTIQTVSPLSIPTNSVFNAQPNFMDSWYSNI